MEVMSFFPLVHPISSPGIIVLALAIVDKIYFDRLLREQEVEWYFSSK